MSARNGFLTAGLVVGLFGMGVTAALGDPTVTTSSPSAASTATDTYVGSAKCRMCHMPQARTHAAFVADTTLTARMTLLPGVTADSKTQGHAANTAHDRANLQCETCHGMGSRHTALAASNRDTVARRATINLPDANQCRSCHASHVLRN